MRARTDCERSQVKRLHYAYVQQTYGHTSLHILRCVVYAMAAVASVDASMANLRPTRHFRARVYARHNLRTECVGSDTTSPWTTWRGQPCRISLAESGRYNGSCIDEVNTGIQNTAPPSPTHTHLISGFQAASRYCDVAPDNSNKPLHVMVPM